MWQQNLGSQVSLQPLLLILPISCLLLAKHWALSLRRSSIQHVMTHQNQNALKKPGTGTTALNGLVLSEEWEWKMIQSRSYPAVNSEQMAPIKFCLEFINCSGLMKVESHSLPVSRCLYVSKGKNSILSPSLDIHIRMRKYNSFHFWKCHIANQLLTWK